MREFSKAVAAATAARPVGLATQGHAGERMPTGGDSDRRLEASGDRGASSAASCPACGWPESFKRRPGAGGACALAGFDAPSLPRGEGASLGAAAPAGNSLQDASSGSGEGDLNLVPVGLGCREPAGWSAWLGHGHTVTALPAARAATGFHIGACGGLPTACGTGDWLRPDAEFPGARRPGGGDRTRGETGTSPDHRIARPEDCSTWVAWHCVGAARSPPKRKGSCTGIWALALEAGGNVGPVAPGAKRGVELLARIGSAALPSAALQSAFTVFAAFACRGAG